MLKNINLPPINTKLLAQAVSSVKPKKTGDGEKRARSFEEMLEEANKQFPKAFKSSSSVSTNVIPSKIVVNQTPLVVNPALGNALQSRQLMYLEEEVEIETKKKKAQAITNQLYLDNLKLRRSLNWRKKESNRIWKY